MRRTYLIAVLAAIALASCAKSPDPSSPAASLTSDQPTTVAATSLADPAGTDGPTASAPTVVLAASTSADDTDDYRIAALDILDISVFQVPDLSGDFPVGTNGQIDLPLIGPMTAAGKTMDQLKADITKILGAKYLQSPDVRVSMKDAISQRITIEGAVNKPGVYPTTGPTTLMTVVALAGGLDRTTADEKGIVVFRKVGGKRQAAKFDYSAIRDGKADDPTIDGGDVVVVDESGLKATLRNLRDSLGLFGLFAPVASMI